MKQFKVILSLTLVAVFLVSACGPTEEELRQREQARLDSLERVRVEQAERARMDSVSQADRAREAAERAEAERRTINYDANGAFAVQVGSWRSESKATEMVATWKSRGFENAYYVQYGTEATGDIWFRVRLGNVATLDEAARLQLVVREDFGAASWVATVRR